MARRRTAAILAALSLIAVAPAATVDARQEAPPPQAIAAHACRSGYTHAVLPSGHKCLRVGQFCSRKRSFQRVYHQKGFHCKVNRHLTHY